MKKGILLLSFSPSHEVYNNRLARLLQDSFEIHQHSFHNSIVKQNRITIARVLVSGILHSSSLFFIALLIRVSQVLTWKFGRENASQILVKSIENYFAGSKKIQSKILNLNRTLRQQKFRIDLALRCAQLAKEFSATCVLLPEDSNYYGSGLMIPLFHKAGVKVGVTEFTTGKESEFEQSSFSIVPDSNSHSYEKFATTFLIGTTASRWLKTRRFINVFPGSLETNSHAFITPSFESGMADFYLTPYESDLGYLRKMANPKSVIRLVESVELTLASGRLIQPINRKIFGLFLPPNQLTDPYVFERLSKLSSDSYEDIILNIINKVNSVCLDFGELVIFPHPRMYESSSNLIDQLSKDFQVSRDFADNLGEIRYALIFSSSVFSALLAAGVHVFNFDLYQYNYRGVFPEGRSDFIEIQELDDLYQLLHLSMSQIFLTKTELTKINEFLVSYL